MLWRNFCKECLIIFVIFVVYLQKQNLFAVTVMLYKSIISLF